MPSTTLFLVLWLLAVPAAAGLIAKDIADEEIFQPLLALIDRRWSGSWLARLVRCPRCLSHWIVAAIGISLWSWWELLADSLWMRLPMVAILWAAAVRIATKFWIS